MNASLAEKIKSADRGMLDRWTDPGTVDRGTGCLAHVREAVDCGDFIGGRVAGTSEYKTNVYLDPSGELESACTCPVRGRCKHAVALILVARQSLNSGGAIPPCRDPDRLAVERESRSARGGAESPGPAGPPKVVERIAVTVNPFERWTEKGGRHGRGFTFGVGEHRWPFIVSSLIYGLAKGGLDFTDCGPRRWDEDAQSDPPLFTCDCGDVHCGGFGPQRMVMTATRVSLAVDCGGTVYEFEFERGKFEYWALLMLWRMRGSGVARKDPWNSVAARTHFALAVNHLLEIDPRCRYVWDRLKEKRRFGEEDFAGLARMPADGRPRVLARSDLMEIFGREFSTEGKLDWAGVNGVTWREEREVAEKMADTRMGKHPLVIHSRIIGRYGQATEVLEGEKLFFALEGGEASKAPAIRVESGTRGRSIGHIRRSDAEWLAAMVSRHGLVLSGHVEEVAREGRSLPVRMDLAFENPVDCALDWGGGLEERDRLYFEMLRALALRMGEFSVATVKAEIGTIRRLVRPATGCPEVAFLMALVEAAATAEELRLTDEAVAKRRAYCEQVRKAMRFDPVGGWIACEGLSVLPLKVREPNGRAVPEDQWWSVKGRIRLSWNSKEDVRNRRTVSLPGFPADATGFAVFRGRELLDVCLLGVPVKELGLFDNVALYERGADGEVPTVSEAVGILSKFLSGLPVRERGEDGRPPSFWLERGIHDGTYDLDENGRLAYLRFLRLSARARWVD